MDVIVFVRANMEQNAPLRSGLLKKLVNTLCEIRSSPVLSVSLWIIGEYAEGEELLKLGFDEIANAMGNPPFVCCQVTDAANTNPGRISENSRSVVLADGTYASQAGAMESQAYGDKTNISPLRAFVSNGDSFLGTVAVSSLTKIVLKSRALYGTNSTLTKQR